MILPCEYGGSGKWKTLGAKGRKENSYVEELQLNRSSQRVCLGRKNRLGYCREYENLEQKTKPRNDL